MTRRAFVGLSGGAALVLIALFAAHLRAQNPLFTTSLPPEEFAAHRAALFDKVGDALVALQGAAETGSYLPFRQNNHFYYLTGVEVPRALVMLDGRTKTTTLFLPPRNERMERSEGPVLVPGDEAARLTGIRDVRNRDAFEEAFNAASLHLPFTIFHPRFSFQCA